MEFEDQEEEQDGEVGMDLSCHDDLPGNPKMQPAEAVDDSSPPSRRLRYKECLKNHAVGIGGHALDGCGEFIAAGDDGTLESLKCAACNCHRNFHRKENEPDGGGSAFSFHQQQQQQQQFLLTHHHHYPHGGRFGYRGPLSEYLHLASPLQRKTPLLALPSSSGGGGGGSRDDLEDYYYSNPNSSSGKKRFRTKFTPEQKDKMLGFAERLGWMIQKQDEEIVQQFCHEVGIKRHVLKVWMHNNKHTLGKNRIMEKRPNLEGKLLP